MLERYNLAGVLIAQRLVIALQEAAAPKFVQMIESEIGNWLENCDFTPDGESEFLFEAMPSAATLDGWEIEDGPSVVSFDENELTFSIDLNCLITFEADFDLQIRDSIDKDFISMGSAAASKSETRTINITVICVATEDGAYEPYEVEMNRQHLHIDFGRVEPEWWGRDQRPNILLSRCQKDHHSGPWRYQSSSLAAQSRISASKTGWATMAVNTSMLRADMPHSCIKLYPGLGRSKSSSWISARFLPFDRNAARSTGSFRYALMAISNLKRNIPGVNAELGPAWNPRAGPLTPTGRRPKCLSNNGKSLSARSRSRPFAPA